VDHTRTVSVPRDVRRPDGMSINLGEFMAIPNDFYTTWAPRLLSVLRIIAAFLFMAHGSQKLFGFPSSGQPLRPFQLFPSGIAGFLELFGGLLLLLGLFTRPVAFILSGQMAVAYFWQHASQGFWPLLNRGELAALYCFLFLYFSVAGGGEWSLDNIWRKKEYTGRSVADQYP
jgi:putative oxidoreductase